MFREILVYTGTQDRARRMSDYAAALASALKARASGIVFDVDYLDYSKIERAITSAERMSAVDALLAQRTETHDAALRAGALFETIARQHNVFGVMSYPKCTPIEIPDRVVEIARLYDCVVLPAREAIGDFDVPVVEKVLFESGRPVIVLPVDGDAAFSLANVVVAWDGSGPAARAIHDALPILREAAAVDILTVTEEKPLNGAPGGNDLARHLKAHDINARCEQARFDGGPVGEQIMKEALKRGAGLLVMGAYGHSRMRQIVFGGATRSVLASPLLPLFMSH